jgi:LPXTG-motif cell wall-anchored protein
VSPVTTDPGAPTGVTVTGVGNGSATLSWTAPADAGGPGAQITGYTVTSGLTQIAGLADTAAPTVTSSPGCTTTGATTCTVTGLVDFTGYYFSVTATNWAGLTGGAGHTTSASTPLPDKPAVTAVTPGDGQVTVTWSASNPVPTVGYTVAATPGAGTCTTTTLTSCVITGLTNGTSYVFNVTADFGNGHTVVSDASASVTPAAPVATTTTTTGGSGGGGGGSAPAPTTGSLPTTGSDSLLLFEIGLLSILAGGALVIATRRSRRASSRP